MEISSGLAEFNQAIFDAVCIRRSNAIVAIANGSLPANSENAADILSLSKALGLTAQDAVDDISSVQAVQKLLPAAKFFIDGWNAVQELAAIYESRPHLFPVKENEPADHREGAD